MGTYWWHCDRLPTMIYVEQGGEEVEVEPGGEEVEEGQRGLGAGAPEFGRAACQVVPGGEQ